MPKRNVLITGGSSGVGKATVERFARGGDNVWFTYRLGLDRARKIEASLRGVMAFALDLGDWESHVQLAEQLPGHVDILVNNAAVGSMTVNSYVDGPDHLQDQAFLQINSVGPLWLCRQFIPGMISRRSGVIINVASVGGGVTTFPTFHVADGMSKAALAYLTRHLAAELARTEVAVYAICPGAVDTPMLRASTLNRLSESARLEFERSLPRGRLITSEEIAEIVWFLGQDAAVVLHGAVIDASMGLGSHPGMVSGLLESAGH